MDVSKILNQIPDGLRLPLVDEYNEILNRYMGGDWQPAELSGGRFCEIVYTILEGYALNKYPSIPSKPPRFIEACRGLDKHAHIPHSFRILIPRLLPGLYDIRNNRNVGHVGGDVDPSFMDSSIVVSMTSWIMAELARVLHDTTPEEAQSIVDQLAEQKTPLVWKIGKIRRILQKVPKKNEIILLLSGRPGQTKVKDLIKWAEPKDPAYFHKLLKQLHKNREIEWDEEKNLVQISPTGSKLAQKIFKNIPR